MFNISAMITQLGAVLILGLSLPVIIGDGSLIVEEELL